MRIYIGGLGATVMEGDLKKTFSSPVLGTVESVEIIRSKDRSFAYLDFVPASEKGLAKLFSTYNGCMWKGGRLKLEKAKEHYIFRLRREWTEDTDLAKKLPRRNDCADENVHTWQTTKKNLDIEQMHLRIYFPKLRKIKPLPLKGSGKHKYSFQRVEVPTLPVHFCDCEEHSMPPKLAEKKSGVDLGMETCGVNEEELSMVKAVLNKLLERENSAKSVSNEIEFTEETYPYISSVDNMRVHGKEDEQVSDDDGLVINVVSHPRNVVSLVKDRGLEHQLHGSKKSSDNKRKAYVSMDDANVKLPYKTKARKQVPQDHVGDFRIDATTRPAETDSGTTQLTGGAAFSKKSAWRDLVNQKGRATFHISDVLTNHNPEVASSNEKDRHDNRSSMDKDSEKVPDSQPIKLSAVEDNKSSRGAAWRKKSSWLQLVGNANNSSFNLAQILPDVATSEKQESQQFSGNDVSSSRNTNQQKSVPEDRNHPLGDIGEPRERANSNTIVAPEIPRITNLDALTKEQNHPSLDEQEHAAPPPIPATNKVPARVPMPAPEIVISDTCPFMRSAASMREWAKMKATLSASHKKRGDVEGE